MKKNIMLTTLLCASTSLFFTGCNDSGDKTKFELSTTADKTYLYNKQNGEVFYIDNKTMYKVVTETATQNKIGEILTLDGSFEYSKARLKTKIYNDSIYYQIDLAYVPKIIEVPDEKNPSSKIKKDVSTVSFEDWKKKIRSLERNYHLTLVYMDQDNFTVITKDILLRNISVNNSDGFTYEGSFAIDKSLATKINKLWYYYNFPEFDTQNN